MREKEVGVGGGLMITSFFNQPRFFAHLDAVSAPTSYFFAYMTFEIDNLTKSIKIALVESM